MEKGRTLGQPLSLQSYWSANLDQAATETSKPQSSEKQPKKTKSQPKKSPKKTSKVVKKPKAQPKKKIRSTQLPWS
jgi:hypothetical protein